MKNHFSSVIMGFACIAIITACNSTNAGSSTGDSPMIDSASVDTTKSNSGVSVGGVMMLPSKSIFQNVESSKDHTTFVAAVKQAEFVETLSEPGPFTVFAPTNEAFGKIPKNDLDNLMKPRMHLDLTKFLTYHIVSGILKVADLKDGQEITTVQGDKLKVTVKNGKVMINDANVTIADVVSNNGIIQVIDAVLIPN